MGLYITDILCASYKYPRTLDADIAMLERIGCTVVFAPTVNDIYPEGEYEKPDFNFGGLDKRMEGGTNVWTERQSAHSLLD